MKLLTREDWHEVRQLGTTLLLVWGMVRGIGWLVSWSLCGCTP